MKTSNSSQLRFGRLSLPVEHAEAAFDCATPLDALLCKERVVTLQKRMRSLTSEQRQVVTMHELEEQPMREVAARLNRPLQTVYSQLHASRRDMGIELSVARAGVRGGSRADVRRVAPASRLAR
jgi:DNA-directed RNA polymerase specialized sigma24 family protein